LNEFILENFANVNNHFFSFETSNQIALFKRADGTVTKAPLTENPND
jgi:hypothetical protein